MPNTASPQPENRFDQAAADWEAKPQRVLLAGKVADAIRDTLPLGPEMTAIEYGCGTGLVCRRLSPLLAHITAVDTSANMLAELAERVAAEGIANITPLLHDLTMAPLPGPRVDLVFSSMTLHHIQDLDGLVARLFELLRPGGLLALADLAPEDGSFHEDNTGVAHHGIDPSQLLSRCARHGGKESGSSVAHVMEKNGRRYPIFLAWCRKG